MKKASCFLQQVVRFFVLSFFFNFSTHKKNRNQTKMIVASLPRWRAHYISRRRLGFSRDDISDVV
jgi:hypothetical protein